MLIFLRYYKNNFADGFRQDAIDLFVGNYCILDGEGTTRICPLKKEKGWKYFTVSLLFIYLYKVYSSPCVCVWSVFH